MKDSIKILQSLSYKEFNLIEYAQKVDQAKSNDEIGKLCRECYEESIKIIEQELTLRSELAQELYLENLQSSLKNIRETINGGAVLPYKETTLGSLVFILEELQAGIKHFIKTEKEQTKRKETILDNPPKVSAINSPEYTLHVIAYLAHLLRINKIINKGISDVDYGKALEYLTGLSKKRFQYALGGEKISQETLTKKNYEVVIKILNQLIESAEIELKKANS